ncbi:MAG: PAS domain S-box protein, partial [Planctomycetota bacterium]
MHSEKEGENAELQAERRSLRQKVDRLKGEIEDREKTIERLEQSERRLRLLAENTQDWVWELDQDFCFTYVNPGVEDLIGYSPSEVEGHTPFDFMPPKEAKLAAEAFNEFLDQERLITGYKHHKWHKDGHLVAVESTGGPIYDGQNVCGFRGVDRDVSAREKATQQLRRAHKELAKRVEERTQELRESNQLLSREVKERREAQAELRQLSRRLDALIEAIPDSLYFKDVDGLYLRVNKAYEELFNVSNSEVVGKLDEEVLPDEMAEQCSESDRRVLEEERSIRMEEELELEGETFWFETVKAPVTDDEGATVGLVGVSRDITHKKEAERARRQAEERYRKLVE